MNEENAFITPYGYLSINKEWLNNTHDESIEVSGIFYSISDLRSNITYSDNRTYYRWDRPAYNRAQM